MKIGVVGPSLKMGGMERASTTMANSLTDIGNEVCFLSLFSQEDFFKLNNQVQLFTPNGFNTSKLSLFKTLIWIRTSLKQFNPDVVLVYGRFYGAIVSLALLFTHYRVFISERSSPLFKWAIHINFFDRIVYWLLPPAGVVAQTKIAMLYQQKYYSKKSPVRVIPNQVKQVKEFPEVEKAKIILAVGRFNDYLKGFDRLIEAYALLNGHKGWRLVFAGGDEDGQYLRDLADSCGIMANVDFLGKVEDIDRVYAEAGIFVIPSRSEGFPNALCEAMAAGLPCVAFDFIAGPRDLIIHRENGFIVPDGDLEALANQIKELIDNEQLRSKVGEKARGIAKMLDQKVIAKRMCDFLNNTNR
ncbi:glycosyltransferase [Cytophagales bacterium LB-30]|uniref:Glycosyltransferase n=1 Tax=Shiella aurantiaca TaxID=3058365 RepID=A0ABT8F847_9BACT|nr:glycosyltransferase [Shiella aurantiaca]MDN4166620.1 glycosyltransferase [Shiella aurantiaca]